MVKEKKALTRHTLVLLIIAVISLAIAGFFLLKYFSPFFLGTIDKETCHNTALTRAAIIEKGGILRITELLNILPPLKCKTQYSCLSMGGKCPEKFEAITLENEEGIKKEIANAMYDCWWMLGEGEKQIFPVGWVEGTTLYGKSFCVICSVISFSEDVQEKHEEIKDMTFYLAENVIPGKNITYSEYFSLGLGDIKDIDTAQKQMIVFKQLLVGITESSISILPYSAEEIKKLGCKVESIT